MKHILIIIPTLSGGGAERQLSLFLQHFDRTKIKITLALYQHEILYSIPEDIIVINLNRKSKYDLFFFFRLIKLINQKKYHIINSKLSGVNEHVMLIAGFLRKKNVILEIRSSIENKTINIQKTLKIYRFFKQPWQFICNTKKATDALKKILPNAPIEFIGNGIDTQKFAPITLSMNPQFTIGYIGRIDRDKNIETLLKALKIVQDKNYLPFKVMFIFGAINDNVYLQEIKQTIIEYQLDKKVEFISQVTNIEQYYPIFDLYLLTSHHEGTPNTLLEAMSSGCVALVSEGANSDNFLHQDFTFETTNAQVLAQKINWIASLEENEIQEIKQYNRNYIKQNYSLIQYTTPKN
ncbi:MAG: glycosyltransferase [Cytophagales bacterium]|nr:MAG: glycosyltransferase [Cytophagales bacterium]